jgi:hypothetical protein
MLRPALERGAGRRFVDALRLFKIGYSWGGPVSLAVPYDLAQMLGPDALSLALDTMLFSPGLPDAQTFGELTITLLTRVDENNHVPEPGSLLLAGLALAALRFGGRRAAR